MPGQNAVPEAHVLCSSPMTPCTNIITPRLSRSFLTHGVVGDAFDSAVVDLGVWANVARTAAAAIRMYRHAADPRRDDVMLLCFYFILLSRTEVIQFTRSRQR